MNPFLPRLKRNLYTVDIIDVLRGIYLLHLPENPVNHGLVGKFNPVLRDEVLRIGLQQLGNLASAMCKIRKEQRRTYNGIPSVVECRINDSSIAFATYQCTALAHFCRHIHLADSRRIIFASIRLCHIPQSP